MIKYEINNTTKHSVNKKNVQETVDKFIEFYKLKEKIELSIAFVSNKEIKRLNKAYRGIDSATDVLSFGKIMEIAVKAANNKDVSNIEIPELAEIIISYEQARRQAKNNKITIKNEINRLLIHGLLHLAGYDHKTDKEEKKMIVMEMDLRD